MDLLTGNNPKTEQYGKKSGIIVFFLLFIAIICLALFMYFKSNGVDITSINIKETVSDIFSAGESNTSKATVTEFGYNTSDHPVFCVYGEYLVRGSRDTVKYLDKSGSEVWSKTLALSSPILKTNGNALLVADKGGTEIFSFNDKGVRWEKTVDGEIVDADISSDGYVTVLMEAKGYKGEVKAYTPSGDEMFKRYIAKNFVVGAGITPSGKQFVINLVDISGVTSTTYMEFFDMSGDLESPLATKVPKQGELFPAVQYLKNDSVAAAGASCVVLFDRNREDKWSKTYNKVYSMSTMLGKYVVIAADSGKGQGVFGGESSGIEILNAGGQQTAVYPVREEIKNIGVCDDIIAVNTGREVHFINSKCKLLNKVAFKSDVNTVSFFNRKEAAVICKNSISIVEIG